MLGTYRSDAQNNAIYARKGIAKPYQGPSGHTEWRAMDIWHDDPRERATMVQALNATPGIFAQDEGDHVHIQVNRGQ